MKKPDIESLVRKHIAQVRPYSSARDEFDGVARVFLDANENPHNSPFNRYPDPHQVGLKLALAKIKKLQPEQIFLGNGSDEIIDLLLRAFCEPAIDNVIIPRPTYGMYAVSATINNVGLRYVNLMAQSFDLDVQAVLKEADDHTKLIFLCSPNNPTGNLLSPAGVIELLNQFHGMVVVDEAYIDFAEAPGFLPVLADQPNLFLLQTLSKAWGLAGIRVGIGMGSEEIIAVLNKIKPPYNIGSHAQMKAIEALGNENQKNVWVKDILQERDRLTAELKKLSCVRKVYPSQANFVLTEMIHARNIYEYLLRTGIVVRDRSNVALCEGCLRITIGTRKENDLLLNELKHL
jgi:histidinol-phosphate aminotransferase